MLGGWRSALFLFRQPFMLIPGTLATVAIAASLLLTMSANGKTSPDHVATLLLIAPLCGFGVAVMTGLPGFMVLRALRPKPALELRDDESVLLHVAANHMLRHEGRGGELYVTSRRLLFVPHRFNVQLAQVEQPLGEIERLEWARIVGAAGLPLSCFLDVSGRGRLEQFVVKDAAATGRVIEEATEAT